MTQPITRTSLQAAAVLICCSASFLFGESAHASQLGGRERFQMEETRPPASCLAHVSRQYSSPVEDGTQRPLNIDDFFSLQEIGGPEISPTSRFDMAAFSVSPDGQSIAFQMRCQDVEQNAYSVGWYTLDLQVSDAEPVFIGDGGDPSLFWGRQGHRISGYWNGVEPHWSPTGDWVAYLRSDGVTTQVWRSRADGTRSEQVTRSEADVEAFYWSDEGDEIWYETDAPRAEREAFIDAQWRGGVWTDNAEMFPVSGTLREQPYQANGGRPSLWVKDLASGAERSANEGEIETHFSSRQVVVRELFAATYRDRINPDRPGSRAYTLSTDGNHAAWIESVDVSVGENLMRTESEIFVQDVTGDTSPISCTHEVCDTFISAGLIWNRGVDELIFARFESADVPRIAFYAWNFAQDSIRKIYEEGSVNVIGCDAARDSLICIANRVNRPRAFVEINLQSGVVSDVYDPNPWVEGLALGDVERMHWQNEYGIVARGWLVKPVGFQLGQRYPLVIVQYNAALCFSGGTGADHPAQLYAAHGIMVLCMSQPSPRPPNEMGEGGDTYERRDSVLNSWESAIEVLDERGMIDPDRVGITGFSMGADNLHYGLHRTNAFNAATSAYLTWSPVGYYLVARGSKGREAFRQRGMQGLEGSTYQNMSLGLNAERVNAPILVQVSDAERLNTTVEYVMLQDGGVPIDMYVFRNEYHTKWWPQNRYGAIQRSLAWMRFWLQGEVDPSTMSEEQFERWQGLCEQHIARLAASDDPVLQARAENQPCASVSAEVH